MPHASVFHVLFGKIPIRPRVLALVLSDAAALQLSFLLAFAARYVVLGALNPHDYVDIPLLLLLGPVFSVVLGTCQSIDLPPHKEVKQLFLVSTLTFLLVLACLFLTKEATAYSRVVILGAWALSIFALPIFRGRLRRHFCNAPWWGRPLVFFQKGALTDSLWQSLTANPQRGLRPVEALEIDVQASDNAMILQAAAARHPDAMALFFMDAESVASRAFIREATRWFSSLLLVPVITMGENRFWLTPRDLGSAVGLLVRQNLLDKRRLSVKRAIDLLGTTLLSMLALPLGAILAVCIRLDSPGPAIYRQQRLGQDGRRFNVYKFRTMVVDADRRLRECLAANPALRHEWEKDQKLREDPRVTRMGAFLRKTSLDELPQLWNVFCGSMSLVGPRPIVENEVNKYGRVYTEYLLVKPGITGLWQVSGRNNTSYAERVRLDHYYVTNWSVWMDLWILARTIPVVIRGHGAY